MMNKTILATLVLSIFLVQMASASSDQVNVTVAGYIAHGPMQPTIDAIKNVTAKYADQVKVTWIDLDTAEGAAYFQDHGLSAHLNVIIDGNYEYNVNGKDVTFQWFEGQGWTKEDLDAVLLSLVDKETDTIPVVPQENTSGQNDTTTLVIGAIIAVVMVAILFLAWKRKWI